MVKMMEQQIRGVVTYELREFAANELLGPEPAFSSSDVLKPECPEKLQAGAGGPISQHTIHQLMSRAIHSEPKMS